jgi:hypothetical protein
MVTAYERGSRSSSARLAKIAAERQHRV